MFRTCIVGLLLICVLLPLRSLAQQSTDPPALDLKNVAHKPVPRRTAEAEMPDAARQKRKGGICVITFIVDAQGNVQNPTILRCSDPMFAENSLTSVQKYKFEPARKDDGTAVPVHLTVEINFKFDGVDATPPTRVQLALRIPPGITSDGPDANGIYPLTRTFLSSPNAPPQMTRFESGDYGMTARSLPDGVACDVVLTILVSGKPVDGQVVQCEKKILEKPALDALMRSKYKPALLNGQPVAIRLKLHLVYMGFQTEDH